MNANIKRTILRWFHLGLCIPVLGYIYEPAAQVQEYAGGVRYIFVPAMLLSGYWMYAGAVFAIVGVAVWLGAYQLGGYGAALLSQVVLFVARRVWVMVRARQAVKAA